MTVQASVYIAASLDGFIARPDGALDWLPSDESMADEDYGYATFMKSVDALVMGRKTYETVRGFGGPWPYTKPVFVLSSKKLAIPREISKTVSAMGGKVDAILSHLESLGIRHVYVDGGITIQKFLNAGAIQRLIITVIPVLLGQGIPLFGVLEKGDVQLGLVKVQSFKTGLVQLEYAVTTPRRKTRATARVSKRLSKRISKMVRAKK